MKKNVSIIGVGLIGGSLGLALQKSGGFNVTGVGRNISRLQKARRMAAVNKFTVDFKKGVQNSDFVIICTPVNTIVDMYKSILPFLKEGCIVSDSGSVKSNILEGIQKTNTPDFFIGSHPLAGLEKTGVEFARPDLFKNASVVVTPLKNTPGPRIQKLVNLWEITGAEVFVMTPEKHDRLVSFISHLPHVISACLVNYVNTQNNRDRRLKKLIAGSFRDMTRISDSDSENWANICSMNRKFVRESIIDFSKILNSINLNSEQDLWQLFNSAKVKRKYLLDK